MTWARRISRAEKAGKFTREDCELAGSFKTCAVYEATGHFQIGTFDQLYLPGMDFLSAVDRGDFAKARKLLKQIQAIARKERK